MKRIILGLLAAAMLICTVFSCACADTVTYNKFKVDSDITTLDLGKYRVGNYQKFFEFLEKLPNLKKVDMYGSYPGPENAAEMRRRFPDVEFGFSFVIGKKTVRTDTTAFSTLYYQGDPVYGYKTISMFRYCSSLYALDIGHNPVRNLDFLYDLPELRVLIVALCDLTDITPIASLEHLEYLEIFHNNITDISCLSGLKHLLDLNLVRNRVQDLTPLAEIKSLKRLWIHWSDYKDPNAPDPDVVAMLREALPDCHIDEVSTSTAGGWRDHSHYKTLKHMFFTKQYEPFEDSDPENMPDPWRGER